MRVGPGDIVSRRKGLVMHRGVVMADGGILHNSPFRGEHVVSLTEFRAGRRLYVERNDCPRSRAGAATAGAHDVRGYNLLTNNCEHTVSRVLHGRPESPQLRSWAAGVGVATLTFALTRHPGLTAAGFMLGRRIGNRF